jgi:dolichol-phosphate mannosyltransferase
MLPQSTEVICVDDGSTDQTFTVLSHHKLVFPKRLLRLSRNFGHQAALLAGLEQAKGEFVVTMDGDLQHPPELIVTMLEAHQSGVDIVLTSRSDTQQHSLFKKLTTTLFYAVLSFLAGKNFVANTSDFRSLNRKALTALLAMPERRKFLRGMVEWIGFSTLVLPYQPQSRAAGESKYSLLKMLKLAFDGITSFSTLPLYFAAGFSCLLFAGAVLYALYVLFVRFVAGNVVSGWASVLFILLIIGGFLSLFLAVIGMYLAAIYDEVKQRPTYIVEHNHETHT